MNAIDRAFGKSTNLAYSLTVRFNGGFMWALGELARQGAQARTENGCYREEGVEFSILREKASNRFFRGSLVVKRVERLYYVEILQNNKVLHSWPAQLNHDYIVGSATLRGKIGECNREWGLASLVFTLPQG
jgi:hypothetical protein